MIEWIYLIAVNELEIDTVEPAIEDMNKERNNTNLIVGNLEFNDKYENTYDMISSLFKGNKKPKRLSGVELSDEDFSKACNEVIKFIDTFDYNEIYEIITDKQKMISLYSSSVNSYDKLEIFRIIYQNGKYNTISEEIMKFINETFHIENSYVYQFNPYNYNQVPKYIIDICDREINRIKLEL